MISEVELDAAVADATVRGLQARNQTSGDNYLYYNAVWSAQLRISHCAESAVMSTRLIGYDGRNRHGWIFSNRIIWR